MQSLIPVINKLQDVFRKTGSSQSIKLPQIVVVGSQSCGKSSVLESLVGKSFLPRGTGIVTRCPIVLQLNQVDAQEGVQFQEYCSFSDEIDIKYTDFDEVRNQIELRTEKLAGNNKGKGISMEPIIVKVYSDNVVPLTVVDLPGLVKNPVGDQPPDIEEQVTNLVMQYIENESTVILAVSPGNTDIATSESIKIAKEVDPEGKRTLAVITKLDIMDKGTNALDVLNGNVLQVKLGIIGVVNRSQEAIQNNLPMKDALEQEMEFCRKNDPSKTGFIGSGYLASRLHSLLVDHIRQTFPSLIKGFKGQLATCEARELLLGPALASTPKEKAYLLNDVISDFIDKFKSAVNVNEHVPIKLDEQHTSFALAVAKIFDKFSQDLNNQKILLTKIAFYAKIESEIQGSVNMERFTSIQEVFKSLAKEQLQQYFLTQTGMIFSCDDEFTKLLKVPVQVEDVFAVELAESARFIAQPQPKHLVRLPVTTSDGIAVLPQHPAFPLTTTFNKSNSDQRNYVHALICGYLAVVRRQIADYIPKHIMRNACVTMIEELKGVIRDETQGKKNKLIQESPEITNERENNKIMIENLQKAMKIIAEIKNN